MNRPRSTTARTQHAHTLSKIPHATLCRVIQDALRDVQAVLIAKGDYNSGEIKAMASLRQGVENVLRKAYGYSGKHGRLGDIQHPRVSWPETHAMDFGGDTEGAE